MTVARRRTETLERLARTHFDVLVIGGGITGAGIARDAALRGLRTALVEQDDFASGTSSRSSRLVHGGVRYLEHGHLHLVFESSRERRTLLRIARHLVRPLGFTWPVYRGARISRPKLWAGLALYDALALFRNVAPHQRLSKDEVRRREPGLRADDLLGGASYYDASAEDARLTLVNVISAVEAGAVAANHLCVTELLGRGRAAGVAMLDRQGAAHFSVRARVIVNATGPWTDALQELEAPRSAPAILGSKGAHIAVPRARIDNRQAITLLHPVDGRVMFVLPAGPLCVIGTTETPADGGPDRIRASREDVRYLLDAAHGYFPAAALSAHDVVSAWAGIRPLAAGLAAGDAGSASREHAISRGALGVLSVTGGKLTTYRAVAEEVVNLVMDDLGRPYAARCRTAELPLPGSEPEDNAPPEPGGGSPIMAAAAERLHAAYGARWREPWETVWNSPALAEPLAPELPYVMAEATYAVECEMAMTLGDVLIRRTRAAFETGDHALGVAPRVAAVMAPMLGWDADHIASELREYEREIERVFGA